MLSQGRLLLIQSTFRPLSCGLTLRMPTWLLMLSNLHARKQKWNNVLYAVVFSSCYMPCALCTIFSPSSCNQYRSLLFFFSKFVNLFKTLCIQACHCLAAQFITNIYYIPFYSSCTSTSLFIQTFNFSMSIMHQAWSISEVRSLIFMQVNLLRDLAQLAATCKAFTKPATLELLAKGKLKLEEYPGQFQLDGKMGSLATPIVSSIPKVVLLLGLRLIQECAFTKATMQNQMTMDWKVA